MARISAGVLRSLLLLLLRQQPVAILCSKEKGLNFLRKNLPQAVALKSDDSGHSDNHFWRNDTANLALSAAWNSYYSATKFSWDVTSPNISDDTPFSLKWSMGSDAPLGWKDGHGCLFAGRYFVGE
eukprot:COSAG01_NODE_7808_length_3047_cov_3.984396_1_plen_126_part_00